ncbi:MAG: hypothetical protein JXR37_00135 [Kiritimatiellae bacterium]|nr:hypothetical protein [Kiritimatiellia bacterium]
MSTETETRAPGLVSCGVSINYTYWAAHEGRLDRLQQECPHVTLGGRQNKNHPRAVEHTERDAWGCLWHYPGLYLDGQVIEHPLDSWEKFAHWRPPSAAERVDRIRTEAARARLENRKLNAQLEHGFLFLRLSYLRGFENFMIDVAEENPKIYELRDIVADYWYDVTKAYLDNGATHVGGGDDLGHQDRLPISPAAWRKLIKPAYARIFGLARQRGVPVRLHTDGYILDIIPDLIETGVTNLNPQDLVNGLDNLARLAKGRIHISLDVDRQNITVFGTPEEVDAHIRNCIRTLGSTGGGLSLTWGVYPGTPIENIEAAVRAMQKYRTMWAN